MCHMHRVTLSATPRHASTRPATPILLPRHTLNMITACPDPGLTRHTTSLGIGFLKSTKATQYLQGFFLMVVVVVVMEVVVQQQQHKQHQQNHQQQHQRTQQRPHQQQRHQHKQQEKEEQQQEQKKQEQEKEKKKEEDDDEEEEEKEEEEEEKQPSLQPASKPSVQYAPLQHPPIPHDSPPVSPPLTPAAKDLLQILRQVFGPLPKTRVPPSAPSSLTGQFDSHGAARPLMPPSLPLTNPQGHYPGVDHMGHHDTPVEGATSSPWDDYYTFQLNPIRRISPGGNTDAAHVLKLRGGMGQGVGHGEGFGAGYGALPGVPAYPSPLALATLLNLKALTNPTGPPLPTLSPLYRQDRHHSQEREQREQAQPQEDREGEPPPPPSPSPPPQASPQQLQQEVERRQTMRRMITAAGFVLPVTTALLGALGAPVALMAPLGLAIPALLSTGFLDISGRSAGRGSEWRFNPSHTKMQIQKGWEAEERLGGDREALAALSHNVSAGEVLERRRRDVTEGTEAAAFLPKPKPAAPPSRPDFTSDGFYGGFPPPLLQPELLNELLKPSPPSTIIHGLPPSLLQPDLNEVYRPSPPSHGFPSSLLLPDLNELHKPAPPSSTTVYGEPSPFSNFSALSDHLLHLYGYPPASPPAVIMVSSDYEDLQQLADPALVEEEAVQDAAVAAAALAVGDTTQLAQSLIDFVTNLVSAFSEFFSDLKQALTDNPTLAIVFFIPFLLLPFFSRGIGRPGGFRRRVYVMPQGRAYRDALARQVLADIQHLKRLYGARSDDTLLLRLPPSSLAPDYNDNNTILYLRVPHKPRHVPGHSRSSQTPSSFPDVPAVPARPAAPQVPASPAQQATPNLPAVLPTRRPINTALVAEYLALMETFTKLRELNGLRNSTIAINEVHFQHPPLVPSQSEPVPSPDLYFLNNAAEDASEVAPKVAEAITDLITAIGDAISSFIESIAEAISSFLEDLAAAIEEKPAVLLLGIVPLFLLLLHLFTSRHSYGLSHMSSGGYGHKPGYSGRSVAFSPSSAALLLDVPTAESLAAHILALVQDFEARHGSSFPPEPQEFGVHVQESDDDSQNPPRQFEESIDHHKSVHRENFPPNIQESS
ncbi:hypothetical protein E2C01_013118 [Portunus trituberculatus]|uniref:Uncharacterized protein n=1 Tax=Portunus trituberculatus TaxID=210409 RepID=A0A5B7DGF5_PORTR|nr:hypothetical protein [Portunus trituberculatus]